VSYEEEDTCDMCVHTAVYQMLVAHLRVVNRMHTTRIVGWISNVNAHNTHCRSLLTPV
jgi:hypothetical protein